MMKTISVQQPYAELVLRGQKRVENRRSDWFKRFRGPLLIHAGKSRERIKAARAGDPDLCSACGET